MEEENGAERGGDGCTGIKGKAVRVGRAYCHIPLSGSFNLQVLTAYVHPSELLSTHRPPPLCLHLTSLPMPRDGCQLHGGERVPLLDKQHARG
jgi:hypothetical protein